MYFHFNLLGRRVLLNNNFLSEWTRLHERNTLNRFVYWLCILCISRLRYGLRFFIKGTNSEVILIDSVTVHKFNQFLNERFNETVEIVLVKWCADSNRARAYVWCQLSTGMKIFVKVGSKASNQGQFYNDMLFAAEFNKRIDLSHASVIQSEYHILSDEVVILIGDYINTTKMHFCRDWSMVEKIFAPMRESTSTHVKGELILSNDQFSYIKSNQKATKFFEKYEKFRFKCCLNHGDLGSENIFSTSDHLFLLDFENASLEAPFLVDPVGIYLSSKPNISEEQLFHHFDKEQQEDLLLALVYLAGNNFPPAIKILDCYFK